MSRFLADGDLDQFFSIEIAFLHEFEETTSLLCALRRWLGFVRRDVEPNGEVEACISSFFGGPYEHVGRRAPR